MWLKGGVCVRNKLRKVKNICVRNHGYLTFSLFIISIWYMLKCSELPLLPLPFGLDRLFLKPEIVDNTLIGVATGYFSSYCIFLLTTWIPQNLRDISARKQAYAELSALYSRMMRFLLLMYKNACTPEEWDEVLLSKTDIDALSSPLYSERMQHFDVCAQADSILLHKESRRPLIWHERIKLEVESFYSELTDISGKYMIYLPDTVNEAIYELKTCNFVEMFTGHYTRIDLRSTGNDGYQYFDDIPVYMYYLDETKKAPLFAASEKGDKSLILRELVERLTRFQLSLSQIESKKGIESRFALNCLGDEKAGHVNFARIEG